MGGGQGVQCLKHEYRLMCGLFFIEALVIIKSHYIHIAVARVKSHVLFGGSENVG